MSKDLGIKDNQVIDMKLGEIRKMKRRKVKERNASEAKNLLHVGDIYTSKNKHEDAK